MPVVEMERADPLEARQGRFGNELHVGSEKRRRIQDDSNPRMILIIHMRNWKGKKR